MRIAINGYGRIGRCVLRAITERGLQDTLQVVAINDLADLDMMAHLTRVDSTHGHFRGRVETRPGELVVDGQGIPVTGIGNPVDLPWRERRVDLVLECAGKFKKRALLADHLKAGAGRVLVSHPVGDADRTLVYGVNHEQLAADDRILSNASCTTNCLAPVAKILHDHIGIEQGIMTTIHAVTNDQQLLDKAHSDAYRARAAMQSIVPTKTGAAAAVGLVLPELSGKLSGMALRVPVANVSLVDLHFTTARETTVEEINQLMRDAAAGPWKDILACNELPLVSIDFNHHPASSIFDLKHTAVAGRQAKVMSWYDNEWGFTNRMIDVALHLDRFG
ncbi:MAG: type I glyceraldehyde-3-phosphate dehydrogenase [Porticoccaceae bacterium]|jgi:glyceraldehyde 3-phosphate dehydrogenase|nr:type I glyceraldehyde-3-phosphate dehydrogenase [Porticoccaceae bacterium]